MTRLRHVKHIVLTLLLVGAISISGSVFAQQSETDAVKAANQAFYVALSSHDAPSMQKVWSTDPDIQNIGPRSKAVVVGWDSIKKGFEATWAAFPELKASMEPRIKIVGTTAWTSGIEHVQRKDKTGKAMSGANLATNIFQKQGGKWVLVYHHASVMPQ